MNLAFSTELNGKPTFFVEKIWQSIPDEVAMDRFSDDYLEGLENVGYDFDVDAVSMSPKRHTIRRDSKNRWNPGNDIHFVINNRTPNRFQFAPVIKCVSVQEISIKWYLKMVNHKPGKLVSVRIDGEESTCIFKEGELINSAFTLDILAHNDGFETTEDFFAYFSEDFTGKIIHWTDLKY